MSAYYGPIEFQQRKMSKTQTHCCFRYVVYFVCRYEGRTEDVLAVVLAAAWQAAQTLEGTCLPARGGWLPRPHIGLMVTWLPMTGMILRSREGLYFVNYGDPEHSSEIIWPF